MAPGLNTPKAVAPQAVATPQRPAPPASGTAFDLWREDVGRSGECVYDSAAGRWQQNGIPAFLFAPADGMLDVVVPVGVRTVGRLQYAGMQLNLLLDEDNAT